MSIKLMGLNVDIITFEEALKKASLMINAQNSTGQVVTINPEMFKLSENNIHFKNIVNEAELVIPDGIGVKIALLINGYKAERIPGIDFAKKLLEYCDKNSLPVAIIGAKSAVLEQAVINLKNEFKNLNIVYTHDGYFTDSNEIINNLKEKEPRLVLIAMGAPKQEEFAYQAKKELKTGLFIGIGGSLDVWSGNLKRAPRFFQNTGTEWLYRTIVQPERFKRIFPALPLFILNVLKHKIMNRSL